MLVTNVPVPRSQKYAYARWTNPECISCGLVREGYAVSDNLLRMYRPLREQVRSRPAGRIKGELVWVGADLSAKAMP